MKTIDNEDLIQHFFQTTRGKGSTVYLKCSLCPKTRSPFKGKAKGSGGLRRTSSFVAHLLQYHRKDVEQFIERKKKQSVGGRSSRQQGMGNVLTNRLRHSPSPGPSTSNSSRNNRSGPKSAQLKRSRKTTTTSSASNPEENGDSSEVDSNAETETEEDSEVSINTSKRKRIKLEPESDETQTLDSALNTESHSTSVDNAKASSSASSQSDVEEGHKCDLCNQTFTSENSYKVHTKTPDHKRRLRKPEQKCKLCSVANQDKWYEFHPSYYKVLDKVMLRNQCQSNVVCESCRQVLETRKENDELRHKVKSLENEMEIQKNQPKTKGVKLSKRDKEFYKLKKLQVNVEKMPVHLLKSDDKRRYKNWIKHKKKSKLDLMEENLVIQNALEDLKMISLNESNVKQEEIDELKAKLESLEDASLKKAEERDELKAKLESLEVASLKKHEDEIKKLKAENENLRKSLLHSKDSREGSKNEDEIRKLKNDIESLKKEKQTMTVKLDSFDKSIKRYKLEEEKRNANKNPMENRVSEHQKLQYLENQLRLVQEDNEKLIAERKEKAEALEKIQHHGPERQELESIAEKLGTSSRAEIIPKLESMIKDKLEVSNRCQFIEKSMKGMMEKFEKVSSKNTELEKELERVKKPNYENLPPTQEEMRQDIENLQAAISELQEANMKLEDDKFSIQKTYVETLQGKTDLNEANKELRARIDKLESDLKNKIKTLEVLSKDVCTNNETAKKMAAQKETDMERLKSELTDKFDKLLSEAKRENDESRQTIENLLKKQDVMEANLTSMKKKCMDSIADNSSQKTLDNLVQFVSQQSRLYHVDLSPMNSNEISNKLAWIDNAIKSIFRRIDAQIEDMTRKVSDFLDENDIRKRNTASAAADFEVLRTMVIGLQISIEEQLEHRSKLKRFIKDLASMEYNQLGNNDSEIVNLTKIYQRLKEDLEKKKMDELKAAEGNAQVLKTLQDTHRLEIQQLKDQLKPCQKCNEFEAKAEAMKKEKEGLETINNFLKSNLIPQVQQTKVILNHQSTQTDPQEVPAQAPPAPASSPQALHPVQSRAQRMPTPPSSAPPTRAVTPVANQLLTVRAPSTMMQQQRPAARIIRQPRPGGPPRHTHPSHVAPQPASQSLRNITPRQPLVSVANQVSRPSVVPHPIQRPMEAQQSVPAVSLPQMNINFATASQVYAVQAQPQQSVVYQAPAQVQHPQYVVHQQQQRVQQPQQLTVQQDFVNKGLGHYQNILRSMSGVQQRRANALLNDFNNTLRGMLNNPDDRTVLESTPFDEVFENNLEVYLESNPNLSEAERKNEAPMLVRTCLNIAYLQILGKSDDFQPLYGRYSNI